MPKPAKAPAAPGSLSFSNLDEMRQKDIRLRLARIAGHTRALIRQLDQGANCDDLLTQAAAVRAAMSAVMARLIEAHIEVCVKQCLRRGRGDEALEGLKKAFTTALRQV
ncbi:MAG: metal-sensitive transcriptional regulator [Acidobacteria bacterium]|nr:metal-sensitive transcriptional regulator [Acidobacteriota bacterium]